MKARPTGFGRALSRALVAVAIAAAGSAPMAAEAQERRGARLLSLEDAIALAEGTSESIAIAKAGVDRAGGEQLRARSLKHPQLNASGSYDRALSSEFSGLFDTSASAPCPAFTLQASAPLADRVSELERLAQCPASFSFGSGSGGALPFGRKNTWRLGLSFSQAIYSGGRIGAQTAIASAAREAAEVGLVAARAELRLTLVESYYNALLGDRLLTIAEATVRQAEATYEQTRLGREAGRLPEFELLRAQVTRDNQRPIVIRRRADRRLAHLRLKQLIELPLDVELQLTTDVDADVLPPPALFAPALAAARAQRAAGASPVLEPRAAVRQAQSAVRLREAAVDAARAQRLPSFNVVSNYGLVSYPGGVLPTDVRTNWTVGAVVQVPVLTGGRLRADELVARAELAETRARLDQTTEVVTLDTQSAFEELDAAEAKWEASAGTVQQAQRAYEIAEIRYREGLSTQLELSDSRLLLVQAQANRAQAGRDLQVARVRVALLPDLPLAGIAAGAAVR